MVFKSGIGLEWTEKACRKRRIDAFEELEEDQANGIAVREKAIAARVGKFGDETFGRSFERS